MNNLDLMLKRNKESAAAMPSLPQSLLTLKAVIIGCADMRVDPAQVLGIKPGEAVVAALRAIPALPGEWLISGLVYDVATGLVEVVVPATPIRTARVA